MLLVFILNKNIITFLLLKCIYQNKADLIKLLQVLSDDIFKEHNMY